MTGPGRPTQAGAQGQPRPGNGSRAGARLSWAAQVAVVLFIVWLLLSGFSAWMVGLGVSIAGGLAGAWLAPGDPHPWRPWRFAPFFAWFLKESLLGGVDVARRVFRARVDVSPCFAHYAMGLPPGSPRTLMVSLVSLLPGTLSADLDAGRGHLLVHALAPEAVATLPELELRIARLFGLELIPARPELHAGTEPVG